MGLPNNRGLTIPPNQTFLLASWTHEGGRFHHSSLNCFILLLYNWRWNTVSMHTIMWENTIMKKNKGKGIYSVAVDTTLIRQCTGYWKKIISNYDGKSWNNLVALLSHVSLKIGENANLKGKLHGTSHTLKYAEMPTRILQECHSNWRMFISANETLRQKVKFKQKNLVLSRPAYLLWSQECYLKKERI